MRTSDKHFILRMWAGLFMAWGVLLMAASACQPQAASETTQSTQAASSVAVDSVTATQTVLAFLAWYKTHIQEANQIELVNQQAGKPYSVNLQNGERYLAYLKSSQLLTDAYLNQWRTYFNERQDGFRMSPQTEGPPTGFEYDLVLLTQDVDMQLTSLKALKVKRINVAKTHATITFVLLDTFEFRLVRNANRWLINEILNQSQE